MSPIDRPVPVPAKFYAAAVTIALIWPDGRPAAQRVIKQLGADMCDPIRERPDRVPQHEYSLRRPLGELVRELLEERLGGHTP